MQLFSVLDKLAGVYGLPFCAKNQALAVRDFAHACRDSQSGLHRNPSDYSLWLVGEFDDQTGQVLGQSKLTFVADATQFVEE